MPPVVSPLSIPALLDGSVGAVLPDASARDALVRTLEQTFAGGDVVLTDSGTSALVMALRAVDRRTGCVAFPAYGCIDLTAAAERAGVTMRLYDLDPRTLNPDLDSLRAALARGVDAVVAVPFYGYPIDYASVAALASRHGASLIEDAAQGAAGEWCGKRLGSFGDASVLSFGRGKGTTGGSGGALIVRANDLRGRIGGMRPSLAPGTRGVREIVALTAQWLLARPSLYAVPSSIPALQLGEMVYHAAGEPRAISRVAARVVRHSLRADAEAVRARRTRARDYLDASAHGAAATPVRAIENAEPGYLRFAMRSPDAATRVAPRLGVVRGYPITLDEHPNTAAILAPGEAAGSGARTLRDALVTLPTHARLSVRDVKALTRWIAGNA